MRSCAAALAHAQPAGHRRVGPDQRATRRRSSCALVAAAIATQRGDRPIAARGRPQRGVSRRPAARRWRCGPTSSSPTATRSAGGSAEEVDRFLSSQEPGGFRSWVEARTPFDDLDVDDGRRRRVGADVPRRKGREWPLVVIVAGAEDGLIPHSSAMSPAQRAEEARLFYVAITRAIDR